MNIYLIRHGEAECDGTSEKVLTQNGRRNLECLIKYLDNFDIRLDYIVSSPLTRAQQTAEYFKKYLNNTNNIFSDNILSPGCSTEDIISLSISLDSENVAFVGHQPDMSRHLAKLISDSKANTSFAPGTTAKVFFDHRIIKGEGLLDFLVPAKK
jgi:phosphohistidine phosphatase